MRAEDLTEKWLNKTLFKIDIYIYLIENINARKYHDIETISHVSDLCYDIYRWAHGEYPSLCSFLKAVVDNDLSESAHLADDINRTALWLYVAFLHNVAPGGWKEYFQPSEGI